MAYSRSNSTRSYSSCEQPTSEISSSSESSSQASESDHPLTRLAQTSVRQIFPQEDCTIDKFFEKHRRALLENRSRDQFLAFKDVPPSVVKRLSSSSSSKFVRCFYNTVTSVLITKTMPLGAHEAAIRYFDILVLRELQTMQLDEEVEYLGSKKVTAGAWTKEADSSWRPMTENKMTLILEVGNSESANHLKTLTHAWLESADAQIGFTISVDQNVPRIEIERWELVPHLPSITTRAAPTSIAAATSAITVAKVGDTTTVIPGLGGLPYFVIPFRKVFNRGPQNTVERDLVLPEHGLKILAERVWKQQAEDAESL